MKLLVIPSWYPPNGGMFFVHQTQWLIDEGIEATVIVAEERSLKRIRWASLPADLCLQRGQEFGIRTYRKVQFRIPKLNRLNGYQWIRTTLHLAEQYIHENGKPELIQAHSCLWAGYVATLLREKYGIPYVITEHRGRFNVNSFFRQQEVEGWHRPMLKTALTAADAIIPVSDLLIPVLEEIAGKKLPCRTIPNPVDENLFLPAIQGHELNTETTFLAITNFQPYKAINVLIDAFHRASLTGATIRLRIAGDGPGRREAESQAAKQGLTQRIHFLGQMTAQEIRDMLTASDFLVLSSHNEGQPVSIGEAALCGKPVICTDVVSEQDVPEFAGSIVKTGNLAALADALLQAHARKRQYDPDAIRAFAVGRFSRKVVIIRIKEVMESIIHTTVGS
jgi:L-malate glycosyltransferase